MNFDWTPILWVGGGFGSVVVLLLGIIAYLMKSERDAAAAKTIKFEQTLEKHEEKFQYVYGQIMELHLTSKSNQELIRKEQEFGLKKLEELHKIVEAMRK